MSTTSPATSAETATSGAPDASPAALDGPRPRLLLVDGHSLAYRAFFALPVENFSTSTGQTTNAVYGFTSMLINLLRDEAPTHLAVAFDVSKRTFRTEEYPEYKAGRATAPAEFAGQVDLVKEVLAALRVTVVTREGYEADDVIATITGQARAQGLDVLVVSGDRDAFQLVDEGTTVLYPRKGVSDLARMTPDAVEEKYGVRPERYGDLAALVGESSDNLPGVPGVGPKTAAKWLAAHGDLTGLVAGVDALPGKAGASLREHLDQVLRNKRLNAPVRDLELPVVVDDLAVRPWDREEVHRVFDGLEFRVLRERLFATLTVDEPEVEGGFDVHLERPAGAGVGAWLAARAAPGGSASGLSVLGRWAAGEGDAWGLAVASGDGAAAWFDLRELDPAAEAALAAWLADPAAPKVLHDAKSALHGLAARGLPLGGLADDTALAAYLCQPDQRSYDLADLAVRFLQRDLRVDAAGGAGEAEQVQGELELDGDAAPSDHPDEAGLACVRAAATLELSGVLAQQVEQRGGTALLHDLELPLVPLLAQMESEGVAVDVEALERLEGEFAAVVADAAEEAYAAIGGQQINLGSPKQLQVVLFETARDAEDEDAPRRAGRRTPRPWPTSTCATRTRSSTTSCATATPRACARPSRGC